MQIELTIFGALQSKQMATQADIERVIGKIETLRGDLHKLVIDSLC